MAASAACSPPAIDRHAVRLVTRVSVALAAIATLSLFHLVRHASIHCFPASHPLALTISLAPFPRTSCDAASRRVVPPDRRLAKLRASPRWRRRAASLAASAFPPLRGLGLLAAPSRVLCLAAGAGHAVDALRAAGTRDATGVDLVDFPPLVRRADPHHLPFSDGAFDLVFSDDPAAISGALFPSRLANEAERAVRRGGGIALAFDREIETAAVAALFKRSRVVDVKDVTLDGSQCAVVATALNSGAKASGGSRSFGLVYLATVIMAFHVQSNADEVLAASASQARRLPWTSGPGWQCKLGKPGHGVLI